MTKPTKDCAPSEDSDQPGHPPCAQWVAKDPSFLHVDSEDSDHTGRTESSLGAQSHCWFCYVVAHMYSISPPQKHLQFHDF